MKWLNFGRCCGKSNLMISTSVVTSIPIIVQDSTRKEILLKQAKNMGYEIDVYTLNEWVIKKGYPKNPYTDNKVLIDEAQDIIEVALSHYLNAEIVASTMTIPIKDIDKTDIV